MQPKKMDVKSGGTSDFVGRDHLRTGDIAVHLSRTCSLVSHWIGFPQAVVSAASSGHKHASTGEILI
jgi:hypothetical protein